MAELLATAPSLDGIAECVRKYWYLPEKSEVSFVADENAFGVVVDGRRRSTVIVKKKGNRFRLEAS